jgi:ribosome-binding protein aMBF1 (putative translation factor)
MKTRRKAPGAGRAENGAPRYRTISGKRMVLLDEAEYEHLKEKADQWEPLMPEPDTDGNYPALAAMRVSIARSILRDRRRAGLTQAELARRAGIRAATLNRIERAEVSPSVGTVDKIDRALRRQSQKTVGRMDGIGPRDSEGFKDSES